jgi:hypothetical protein
MKKNDEAVIRQMMRLSLWLNMAIDKKGSPDQYAYDGAAIREMASLLAKLDAAMGDDKSPKNTGI